MRPRFYELRVVVLSVTGLPHHGYATKDTRFLRLVLNSAAAVCASGSRSVTRESHAVEEFADPVWTR